MYAGPLYAFPLVWSMIGFVGFYISVKTDMRVSGKEMSAVWISKNKTIWVARSEFEVCQTSLFCSLPELVQRDCFHDTGMSLHVFP